LYQLVRIADWSYCVRNTQKQHEIGGILKHFRYPFDVLGDYYEAQYLNRNGLYEVSTKLLERVYEQGPERYRARALQTLSAKEEWQGKIGEALRFRVEAIKIGDPFTSLEAQLGVAICKSVEGDHRGAIRHIEQFLPMVRAFYRSHSLYFNYLNSYAVELGEVGRIKEAQNVCRITLASPYVIAYPEWRETWQDLALRGYKSRSVVSVPKLPVDSKNVVPLPVVERSPGTPQQGQAQIFDLQKWKDKMVKEPNGEHEDVKNMDEKDLFLKLMQLSTQDDITRKKLLKLVEYAMKVISEPD
jgi:hypothetical protein